MGEKPCYMGAVSVYVAAAAANLGTAVTFVGAEREQGLFQLRTELVDFAKPL